MVGTGRSQPGPGRGPQRLLGGAAVVSVGLGAAGAGTLAMMALAARALPPSEYASFAIWWTVATLLGVTFWVFEAYLARLVVAEVAAGRSARRVTGVLTGRAWLAAAIIAAATSLASPWLASQLFAGSLTASLLLPLFVFLSATQAVQRGVATGHSRFSAMGGQLMTDGLARAGLTGLLVLVGGAGLESLAAATCVAAATSLVTGSVFSRGWFARPRLRDAQVPSRPITWLLVAAGGPVLINSGAAPWLALADTEGALTIGAFAGAVTLSRIPAQFAAAAFSPLLAQLSFAVEQADVAGLRRLQRSADLVGAVLTLVFTLTFAVAGPWILSLYLGPTYSLPVVTLVLLAAASGLMLAVVIVQASLAAFGGWPAITQAWVAGTVVLAVALLLPLPPLGRAAVGPLAATLSTMAWMVVSRARLRKAWIVTPESRQATVLL